MLPIYIYVFKVSIAILSFYLLYYFLFQKDKHFKFVRLFLPISVIVSFLIPLLSFTVSTTLIQNSTPAATFLSQESIQTVDSVVTVLKNSHWVSTNLNSIILYGYLIICILLIVRLLYGYIVVNNIIRRGTKHTLYNENIIITTKVVSPFSFLKYIVIPENQVKNKDLPLIIEHEKAHIKQRHFVDTFLSELISSFLWFNPFAWLLKNAMQANLEYMADNSVLSKSYDMENYQMAMVRLLDNKNITLLTNNLNVSQIKNRIIMMKSKNQNRHPVLKKLSTLPLALLLIVVLSGKEYPAFASNTGEKLVTGTVTSTVDKKPLSSVSVLIKGRNVGTITDENGNFSINVNDDDKVLIFKSIGYESKKVEIIKTESLNVSLKKSNSSESKTAIKTTDENNVLIKGSVKSQFKDKPLASVNVLVKGKQIGTITDNEGIFYLNVDPNDKVLVFICQGYESKEVEIKKSKTLEIKLSAKN